MSSTEKDQVRRVVGFVRDDLAEECRTLWGREHPGHPTRDVSFKQLMRSTALPKLNTRNGVFIEHIKACRSKAEEWLRGFGQRTPMHPYYKTWNEYIAERQYATFKTSDHAQKLVRIALTTSDVAFRQVSTYFHPSTR